MDYVVIIIMMNDQPVRKGLVLLDRKRGQISLNIVVESEKKKKLKERVVVASRSARESTASQVVTSAESERLVFLPAMMDKSLRPRTVP